MSIHNILGKARFLACSAIYLQKESKYKKNTKQGNCRSLYSCLFVKIPLLEGIWISLWLHAAPYFTSDCVLWVVNFQIWPRLTLSNASLLLASSPGNAWTILLFWQEATISAWAEWCLCSTAHLPFRVTNLACTTTGTDFVSSQSPNVRLNRSDNLLRPHVDPSLCTYQFPCPSSCNFIPLRAYQSKPCSDSIPVHPWSLPIIHLSTYMADSYRWHSHPFDPTTYWNRATVLIDKFGLTQNHSISSLMSL